MVHKIIDDYDGLHSEQTRWLVYAIDLKCGITHIDCEINWILLNFRPGSICISYYESNLHPSKIGRLHRQRPELSGLSIALLFSW